MCIRLFLVRAERTRYINVKHSFRFVSERNKSEREDGEKTRKPNDRSPSSPGLKIVCLIANFPCKLTDLGPLVQRIFL